jgi:hypothetical protein
MPKLAVLALWSPDFKDNSITQQSWHFKFFNKVTNQEIFIFFILKCENNGFYNI